ncbi:MAG: S41 family peptidase [Deltaproteobacteria bacterium]|nr:S41 family peptidase [Deltaproteobacteria bacterium]
MPALSPVRAFVIVSSLFLVSLSAGTWGGLYAARAATSPYESLDLLARVLAVVERDYVEALPEDALVEGAIEGVVARLDEHSRWLGPEDLETFERDIDGSYVGIGVEITPDPRGALVQGVLPGGPAERDGVLAGDLILAVNGATLEGLALPDISDHIKGKRGLELELQLERDGAPLRIDTVRDEVIQLAVHAGWLAPGVAYAQIEQFHNGTSAQLSEALERLRREAPLEGVVLDLRDNPGGLIEEAVATVDLFVDDGLIVSTRGRLEQDKRYYGTSDSFDTELPVVIAVNGRSASAAEIVSGALHERGRATLVGQHTYGKGSVQTLYKNRNGTALKLTIARYYLPSGAPVERGEGIAPDRLVPGPGAPSPTQALRDRLAAISLSEEERAEVNALIDALPPTPGTAYGVDWSVPIPDRAAADPQLEAALALLR